MVTHKTQRKDHESISGVLINNSDDGADVSSYTEESSFYDVAKREYTIKEFITYLTEFVICRKVSM